MTTQGGGTCM